MRTKEQTVLNTALADKLINAFRASTGVDCFLLEKDSRQAPAGAFPCAFCRLLQEFHVASSSCLAMHRYNAAQSERFGGRYIYFCPHGLAHFVSPVFSGGKALAYLVGGPVLILQVEDFLAGLSFSEALPEDGEARLTAALAQFPRRDPGVLNHLSFLLFSLVSQLGNCTREMLTAMEIDTVQRSVGDAILELNQEKLDCFPTDREQALIQAVADGNLAEAKQAFNELTGYIFFHSGGDVRIIRSLAAELLFTLSSAARNRGLNRDEALSINGSYYTRLGQCQRFDEIIVCLNEALQLYVHQVDSLAPAVEQDAVEQALRYIRLHYCDKLTLETVAAQVSLSPVYFSRLFKESTGLPFNVYLNRLRIRKSAAMLAETRSSILDIATQCGFEDQSYFSKVFKKHLHISPAQFRRQPLDINSVLEKGGALSTRPGRSADG